MMTKWLTWTAVGSCFAVAAFLFFHNLAIINEDIGRHIKLGEIIWQTKSVPRTNLLSYTAADFPFINHHWLSEVIFYGFYNFGGLTGVMVAKILILLAAYVFLLLIVKERVDGITVLSFLLSLVLISMRTDPRPEIFTYLIAAIFFFVIYRVRDGKNGVNLLWLLPPLELLWVNFHIYFVIGLIIYGAFLIERFFLKRLGRKEVMIGIALALATLVNPNGLRGALYPLTILHNYDLPIAENYPILEFVRHYHAWLFPYKFFLASIAAIALGIVLRLGTFKHYLFEILLFVFLTISSFQLARNIGVYAVFSFPATVALFHNLKIREKFPTVNKVVLSGLIIFMAFFINSIRTNAFYENVNAQSRFGLSVPKFMQQAVDFFQNNNLPGPIFNDIGIGSYLEWKLYPAQKAFSDNRPEAYPVSFWRDVYIPMQADYRIWRQKNSEYGIRSVIIDHMSIINHPAGQRFLSSILKDPDWPLVFVNDHIVIFVKKSKDTQRLIDAYAINDRNIQSRVREITDTFDHSDDLSYRELGDFLYKIDQFQAALIPYQKLMSIQPGNSYGYERHALTLAAGINKNGEHTDLILAELQKAISLGANDANDYFVIAFLSAAKNDLTSARIAIQKAHRLNPYDQRIKSLYSQLVK